MCALTGLAVFVWWLWCEDAGLPTSRLPERHGRLVPQERVLFVCTHNSARSQMGEAILRQLGGSRFYVASAGTRPTMVNPLTLQVMGSVLWTSLATGQRASPRSARTGTT